MNEITMNMVVISISLTNPFSSLFSPLFCENSDGILT